MDVSIVTPVYNEENNIQPFFEELVMVMREMEESFEIVAVDDGSTDSSFDKINRETGEVEQVKLIRFEHNHGQSKALQAGIDNSVGNKIVTIDSDLQNDPRDIPRLLEELERTDHNVISGLRTGRQDPLKKKIASSIASKMRGFLFENEVKDYGCTLKAFEREAAETLELHEGMHRYIPVLLEKEGLNVSEVEVNHRERYSGESKYGFWRLPRGFIDMVDLWLSKKYGGFLQPRLEDEPDYSIEKVME